MDSRGVLTEAFGRITELYDGVADGLDDETLHHRPGGTGNPIAWLLWHLAYIWRNPSWHKRIRLIIDWLLSGLLGRETGQMRLTTGLERSRGQA